MNIPPLDGITVLDLSHALAGPYCTLLMATYGARVIKVENPEVGDIGRTWGPPFLGSDAAFFVGLNSGKQSIVLDLKHPEGVALCKRLANRADILIENLRPGVTSRLGLGYDELSRTNPRLIYVSVSGYGQTGPRRNEPAMDLIVQASSGLMSVTGTPSGETVRCGHSVADINAGMFALIGALMALEARHRTGRGQFVDVSMVDTLISAMAANYANLFGSGIVPGPMGTRFATIVPYRNFACADREITIAVASKKLWDDFCQAIDHPEFAADERFKTNELRVKNRGILEPMLEAIFRERTAAEWIERLSEFGTPCTLVRNLREIVEDEQSEDRRMFPRLDHPQAGAIRVTGLPLKFSETAGRIGGPAPGLGADTCKVLTEVLGISADELESLRHSGAIA